MFGALLGKLEKIKGFSLAEVIISLGVVSTTMIVAISMTSQSLRLAKENELQNTANEFLVQALELSKSPAAVKISPASGTLQNLAGSYKMSNLSTGVVALQSVNLFTDPITVDDCDQTSPAYEEYKIQIDELNAVICNQILLEPEFAEGGVYNYKITSIVVYTIGGEKVLEKVESFREGTEKDFSIVENE